MTAACNFISSGKKMRELLDKQEKEEKKKNTDHIIGQKRRKICAVFFGEAE